MNEYTPGPWYHRTAIRSGEFIVQDRGSSGGFAPIARIKGDKRSTLAQAEANARLISAAPELLDALETYPALGVVMTDAEMWAWIGKAKTAIDKARGVPASIKGSSPWYKYVSDEQLMTEVKIRNLNKDSK